MIRDQSINQKFKVNSAVQRKLKIRKRKRKEMSWV